ncbi:extracellular serine-rich protein [Stemphylium lycopersici]|uniref:Extracellular serine-rich protein n=1 Tax=Stemphylium lycopersici TaxID=183478 RepID=A0A364NB06_STELY|nr:extracellular serine-rich protein [Stemphylium lycopersici]RAR12095.1 extracellular serine-rich protein [Stemphylium lycopersici]RAR14524.1 extracellular serine-rich protein [Stemphylium lycopersici]
MYFSRATIISAVFGFAVAQESSSMAMSESSPMASATAPTLSTSVVESISTASPSAAAGMLKMHTVQVGGPNGSLAFYPDNVVAAPGDMIQFQFHPKNHSVVQSTFDNPCVPITEMMPNKTDAFFSGFMPTNASFAATSQVLTYTIRVTDDKPMWFYCSQGKHCQAGMVGAINAPTSGNKTMAAFAALAAEATENLSPGQAAGSGGASGNTPTSPSAGSGADSGTEGGAAAGGASGTASAGAPENTANGAPGLNAQSFFGAAAAVAAALAVL